MEKKEEEDEEAYHCDFSFYSWHFIGILEEKEKRRERTLSMANYDAHERIEKKVPSTSSSRQLCHWVCGSMRNQEAALSFTYWLRMSSTSTGHLKI